MVSSSLQQRLEDIPRTIFQNVVRVEGSTSSFIDFSVLSVAVTTLAMILFVQFIRQQLDSKAIGQPFLKTVLKGVYAECKFWKKNISTVSYFFFINSTGLVDKDYYSLTSHYFKDDAKANPLKLFVPLKVAILGIVELVIFFCTNIIQGLMLPKRKYSQTYTSLFSSQHLTRSFLYFSIDICNLLLLSLSFLANLVINSLLGIFHLLSFKLCRLIQQVILPTIKLESLTLPLR
jgi:hypothetical protein